uniref:G-protein coupled receptors family 1 profile domain-containing protein n=1 Tax=Meloidogyne enterolobii TaxID=390850 RepID=A0A6V7V842_MELEN|nr:unnamed protein product [Meloidogyne enterolobii]
MAIDRYYSVRSIKVAGPSSRSGNCVRALLISVLIWVLSLLLSFPLLIYYQINMLYVFKDVYVLKEESSKSEGNSSSVELKSYGWRQCRLTTTSDTVGGHGTFIHYDEGIVNERMVQLGMSLMQALMLYAVPLVVLLIFNLKLTRFLEKNSKNMNNRLPKMSVSATQQNRVEKMDRRTSDNESLSCAEKLMENSDGQFKGANSTKSGSLVSGVAVASSTTNNLRKSSGGALINNQQKRRNKTTSLLIAMAGSYAFLWFPFTLISVLIDLDLMEGGSPTMERVDQACKLISILSICVNPFLYGFLNTNFRSEFNEIFIKCIHCLPLILRQTIEKKQSTKIQIVGIKRRSVSIKRSNSNSKKNCFDKNKDIIL